MSDGSTISWEINTAGGVNPPTNQLFTYIGDDIGQNYYQPLYVPQYAPTPVYWPQPINNHYHYGADDARLRAIEEKLDRLLKLLSQ